MQNLNFLKPVSAGIKNTAVITAVLISVCTGSSCRKTYEVERTTVIINELMPVNLTTVPDNYGEYDDWIELYNLTPDDFDLSGYYLSDSKKRQTKWHFPGGTKITGYGYLIVWADGDSTQTGLHTNFKLSDMGETLELSRPDLQLIDRVKYPAQAREFTFSRIPNGKGGFTWTRPTFNRSNDY